MGDSPRRRFYLCPPDYFRIEYSINPWMDVNHQVDSARAREQWASLFETYVRLGADVHLIEPEPGLPELVFPGDSMFLFRNKAYASRFRHPERDPEVAQMTRRFRARGFKVETLPRALHFEGNAEAIYWNGRLMCGCGIRSDCDVFPILGKLLNVEIHTFRLTEPYFHFDVTFCGVDKETAVYFPGAFTAGGRELMKRMVPRLIEADENEARVLGVNSVSINGTVVMSTPRAPKLAARLRAAGHEVIELDLSEFYKAGGGAKCLTLESYEYQTP